MKKESRVQKILMLILSFTLLTTSLLASTISRYVSEEKAPFGEDEHLDYTVNSVFVVKNQEELFAAVNQGYTYVQLDPQIENPLIVTQKAENLDADLILDLNGIEIQRNGYEPILNVKKGVRLTIVDTSAEQTGGLYNPVGSVFNITGGTLTVVTGTFESGPRYSEYYSYNTDVLSTSDPTKRTLVENSAKKVCFYKKTTNPDKTWTFSDPTELNAPIIKSYPEKIGNVEYTHGNLYFDQTITKGDLTINPDTYCYYRTSEDKAAEVNNEAAADWYYTYFVDPNNKFEYAAAKFDDPSQESNYVKITIYGYENTIKQAAADKSAEKYYAAIQMQDGTLDVQNGSFYSYFGVDKTACVNAQKGDLKIKKGKFSSRIPDATRYDANSVVIKEPDEKAFEETYFDNYHWSSDAVGAEYRGNLARQGESYCILNGGSANVTIGTGDLYSSNNGIINMQGGELSISGGTFYKRLTNGRVTVDESEMSAIYMEQGELDISNAKCYVLRNDSLNVDSDDKNEDAHAIYMRNGILNVTDTTYHIEGDNSIGVKMESGKLAVTGGACEILGSNTYGIHSTVKGAGNFVVTNTSFALSGTNAEKQTGIYAINSQLKIENTTGNPITISIMGNDSKGIYVEGEESIVDSINYDYNLTGTGCYGIHMINGTLTVKNADYTVDGDDGTGIEMEAGVLSVSDSTNYYLKGNDSAGIRMLSGKLTVDGGECEMDGSDIYGIYSTVTGEGNFVVTDTEFNLIGADNTNQTGIYAENSQIKVTATAGQKINIAGANSKGIHAVGASAIVTSNAYSYLLEGIKSAGIYAEGGLVDINGGDITLTSNQSCYGVYAFSATEEIQIDITGAEINVGYDSTGSRSGTVAASIGVFLATSSNANKITLTDANIKCYEVGVLIDGGSLDVKSTTATANEILTRKASSIVVKGGNITFDSTCDYNITSSNTRTYDIENNNEVNFNITTAEDILKTYDTNAYNLTIPNLAGGNVSYVNTDGIYVEGGNFTVNGAVSVTHTGLANDFELNRSYATQTITSYAVRVTGGTVTIVPSSDTQNVSITANVGGGVYCGKSDTANGELILGKEGANNNTVQVLTKGRENTNAIYHGPDGGNKNGNGWNWSVPVNLTGGNAVELNGGNITLNCGTYTANFGNGILAKIPYTAESNSNPYKYPTITVKDGVFKGQMNFGNNYDKNYMDNRNSGFSGPASSYGIKVIGGADVKLYKGTYTGAAGGVMITGISQYSGFYGNWAKLSLYGGLYGCDSTTTFTNAATDGIMIFDKSLVAIGAYGNADADKANINNLTIVASLCPISANPLNGQGINTRSEVNVYYAKFLYDQSVIYNEGSNSATIRIYNRYNADMHARQDFGNRNGNDGEHTIVDHTGTKYFAASDYSNTAQTYWNAQTIN